MMNQTLVGLNAPKLIADAVLPSGEIVNQYDFISETKGQYRLVFFYPLDFTFVCPTELLALDKRMAQFKQLNVAVAAVSIDSVHTHFRWRNTPINEGGIGAVQYPLIADINHQVCQSFGVQSQQGMSFRGAFLVDQAGIIKAQWVHDLPLGRNIDEFIRVVEALQHHEQYGEVCPAGWQKEKSGMKESHDGVKSFLTQHAEEL